MLNLPTLFFSKKCHLGPKKLPKGKHSCISRPYRTNGSSFHFKKPYSKDIEKGNEKQY